MMKTLFSILCLGLVFTVVKGASRCYGDLGCFDSGVYHALPQNPDHVRTQYRLSCRNKTDDVIIEAVNDESTKKQLMDNSCFAADRPTKFIIHGFTDSSEADWVKEMRDLLLEKGDFNVLTVDWNHGAKFPYVQALANAFLVAKQTALFTRHLETVQGLSPLDVHVIGHSLGAQIAGNIGRDVRPTRLGHITGLDPAEPYFSEFDDTQRLDRSDAIFVDVIHTDGEKFTGLRGYGSLRSQGHVDFFPNGGERQPGCVPSSVPGTALDAQGLQGQLACSHTRAYELYAQSLRAASCPLKGYACGSVDQFEAAGCQDCSNGTCLNLGLDYDVTTGPRGNFLMSTTSSQPYCGTDYQISIALSPNQQHAYGRLFFILEDSKGDKSNVLDFSRKGEHYHNDDLERHVMTTSLDEQVIVTQVYVRFEMGSGLSALGTTGTVLLAQVNVTALVGGASWQCSLGRDTVVTEGGWTSLPATPVP